MTGLFAWLQRLRGRSGPIDAQIGSPTWWRVMHDRTHGRAAYAYESRTDPACPHCPKAR